MNENNKITETANSEAFNKICSATPTLVDVNLALDAIPNMTKETILTSGPPLDWDQYTGGQRNAIIGGALFEGLAKNSEEVEAKINSGHINLKTCDDYDCVGSITGVTTASMAVFVVENRNSGNRAFCTFFEGEIRERLTYGSYNEKVKNNLHFLSDVIAPILRESVIIKDGIPLQPLMRRALHMGDELHSRNTASTFLFAREIFPSLLKLVDKYPQKTIKSTLDYITKNQYSFLRLSMAAAKSIANSARNIDGSSIVTYMGFNCKNFGIKVSGLNNECFIAPVPKMEAKLFEGYSEKDVLYAGGESMMAETVGFGGLSSAAAFPLQNYVLATPKEMVNRTLEMYKITHGEHGQYKIPFLEYRGIPTAIDIHKVVSTGIVPVMNIGAAGKDGTQIGAGVLYAPLKCFKVATDRYNQKYQ